MRARSGQQGFALVAALFLIVVLALFSVFAVRVSAAGEQDVTSEVMESRALSAARSGIEYGANRALRAAPSVCSPAPVPINLTQSALNGFTVTVTCNRIDHLIGAVTYQTFFLDATARRGAYGTADYVGRRVTRTVTNAPP